MKIGSIDLDQPGKISGPRIVPLERLFREFSFELDNGLSIATMAYGKGQKTI
jgi:hypothetical protein